MRLVVDEGLQASDYFSIFDRGEEFPGLYAFALGASTWVGSTTRWRPEVDGIETRVEAWPHRGAMVAMAVVRPVAAWPDTNGDWEALLDEVLGSAVRSGAHVAWAGAEDSSWNPVILQPGNRSGNVAATYWEPAGLSWRIDDSGLMTSLDDGRLGGAWAVASPLLLDESGEP